jgi:4'-phosphopantetheinyl transferase
MVVYAFTLNHAIGVDMEKIRDDYHPGVAQRFFSPEENAALLSLPQQQRPALFYRIWACKEALAKAVGKGIFMHLSSISVPLNDDFAEIMIDNDNSWSLFPLTIHPAYQSAVATNQRVKKMTYWKWIDHVPVLDKTETF